MFFLWLKGVGGSFKYFFKEIIWDIYKEEGGFLIQISRIRWDIKWMGGESNIPAEILFEAYKRGVGGREGKRWGHSNIH